MGGVLIYCEDSLFKIKVKNGTIDKQNIKYLIMYCKGCKLTFIIKNNRKRGTSSVKNSLTPS